MTLWLDRMQNGALGEARTRAFLANSFWVLERSVDVQGADFLIQRNTLLQSVTDTRPPRLAIIQAKFAKSGDTEISIPIQYIQRSDKSLVEEFFLILSTGYGDDERMFLLSSQDIDDLFAETVRDGRPVRALRAKKIFTTSNYEITRSRDAALRRINTTLVNSEYKANRRYIFTLGFGAPELPDIHSDYQLPIENGFGDIAEQFQVAKRQARESLWALEEIGSLLQTIVDEEDPFSIEEAMNGLGNYTTMYGRISITAPDALDDVMQVVRDQRTILSTLRSAGVFGSWIALLATVRRAFREAVDEAKSSTPAAIHFSVKYDALDFGRAAVDWRDEPISCAGPLDAYGAHIELDKPGEKQFCLPTDLFSRPFWKTQSIYDNDYILVNPLQELSLRDRFPDDPGPWHKDEP